MSNIVKLKREPFFSQLQGARAHLDSLAWLLEITRRPKHLAGWWYGDCITCLAPVQRVSLVSPWVCATCYTRLRSAAEGRGVSLPRDPEPFTDPDICSP